MEESIRKQDQEDEEVRREEGALPPLPVYDDGAARRQSELYRLIAERGPFLYDADADPLYRLARDRSVQNGRLAMRDAMGQAAALTGGFDSSYGQAVGQQQYDASLQGLAELIPQLYETAYQRYRDQGAELEKQYRLLGDQADRDYDRYRDALGDWQAERAWQQEQEAAAYDRAADAYARLYALIAATGYTPTEEELSAANMSPEAAEALRNEYLRAVKGSGSSSGSARRSSSGSAKRYTLQDVTKSMNGATQSNQQKEVYDTYRRAVSDGRANFSLQDLNALFRRNHWHS